MEPLISRSEPGPQDIDLVLLESTINEEISLIRGLLQTGHLIDAVLVESETGKGHDAEASASNKGCERRQGGSLIERLAAEQCDTFNVIAHKIVEF